MFTTRAWANRKFKFAAGNIQQAEDHIIEVAKEYELSYPKEYESMCVLLVVLKTARELTESMHV